MEGLFSFLLFAGFFYLMMRFGCGAHMIHGSHGHKHSDNKNILTPCVKWTLRQSKVMEKCTTVIYIDSVQEIVWTNSKQNLKNTSKGGVS